MFETCRIVLAADWPRAAQSVLHGLRTLGPRAGALVPDVVALYDRPHGAENYWLDFVPVLTAIGAEDVRVHRFLGRLVRDTAEAEGWRTESGAAEALARMGPRGQAELLETSAGAGPGERLTAIEHLARAGLDPLKVLELVVALLRGDGREEDSSFEMQALGLLATARVPAAQGVPVLRPFVESGELDVRAKAILALSSLQDPPPAVLETLAASMRHEWSPVAYAAVEGLANVRDRWPRRVLELWVEASADPRGSVSACAMNLLETLVETERESVLSAWLAHLAGRERAMIAAALLATHAPRDPRVLAAFREIARGDWDLARRIVLYSLGATAEPQDYELVFVGAQSEDPHVRAAAYAGLRNYLRTDRDRIRRAWISALDDPHVAVRHQAVSALGALGAEAAEAVPALEALHARERSSRYPTKAIEEALARIRAAAPATR